MPQIKINQIDYLRISSIILFKDVMRHEIGHCCVDTGSLLKVVIGPEEVN